MKTKLEMLAAALAIWSEDDGDFIEKGVISMNDIERSWTLDTRPMGGEFVWAVGFTVVDGEDVVVFVEKYNRGRKRMTIHLPR